jgi:hypothetical protein
MSRKRRLVHRPTSSTDVSVVLSGVDSDSFSLEETKPRAPCAGSVLPLVGHVTHLDPVDDLVQVEAACRFSFRAARYLQQLEPEHLRVDHDRTGRTGSGREDKIDQVVGFGGCAGSLDPASRPRPRPIRSATISERRALILASARSCSSSRRIFSAGGPAGSGRTRIGQTSDCYLAERRRFSPPTSTRPRPKASILPHRPGMSSSSSRPIALGSAGSTIR